MPKSKYLQFQRERSRSSSVEIIPNPNVVYDVIPVEPASHSKFKEIPGNSIVTTNINNNNCRNAFTSHRDRVSSNTNANKYDYQRSRRQSFSPLNNYQTRSFSPLPHQRGRSRSPLPYQQRSRSRSPLPYQQRSRSRSPYGYRRNYSRSSRQYRRDHTRSPSPYQRDHSRSPYRHQRDYSPSSYRYQRDHSSSPYQYQRDYSLSTYRNQRERSRSPYRYQRDHSELYDQYRRDNSRSYYQHPRDISSIPSHYQADCYRPSSLYYHRRFFSRSISPYHRRSHYSPSPTPPRGRSRTTRHRQKANGNPEYIPLYKDDKKYNRTPSPDYLSSSPSHQSVSFYPRSVDPPSSPIYISSSVSRSPSPIHRSRWSTSSSPPLHHRRSLSPKCVSTRITRTDMNNSRNDPQLLQIGYIKDNDIPTTEMEHTPLPAEDDTIVVDPLPATCIYLTDFSSSSSPEQNQDDGKERSNMLTYSGESDKQAQGASAITQPRLDTARRSKLPSHWKVKITNDGEIYYFNSITNERSSTRPLN